MGASGPGDDCVARIECDEGAAGQTLRAAPDVPPSSGAAHFLGVRRTAHGSRGPACSPREGLAAEGQLVHSRDESASKPKDPGLMQDAADACGS